MCTQCVCTVVCIYYTVPCWGLKPAQSTLDGSTTILHGWRELYGDFVILPRYRPFQRNIACTVKTVETWKRTALLKNKTCHLWRNRIKRLMPTGWLQRVLCMRLPYTPGFERKHNRPLFSALSSTIFLVDHIIAISRIPNLVQIIPRVSPSESFFRLFPSTRKPPAALRPFLQCFASASSSRVTYKVRYYVAESLENHRYNLKRIWVPVFESTYFQPADASETKEGVVSNGTIHPRLWCVM